MTKFEVNDPFRKEPTRWFGLGASSASLGEAHPGELELRDFADGTLAEPDLERLAEHLGQCAFCRQEIDDIARRDVFLARLQSASVTSEDFADRPGERRAATRALRRAARRSSASGGSLAHDHGALPREVGPYVIVREIGRGGMGVVYLARHAELDRPVALKMILSGEFASEVERQRFRREAELAARVRHPNIVQVYEVGLYRGRPYLALEWCDGGSLADQVGIEDWAPMRAAELVATLADAIEAAHRRGVVHRDLKPSNILLQSPTDPGAPARGGDAIPKVADFGLARALERKSGLTSTGDAVGTPQYMAPEQANGKPAGPPADIYALGAILYELLTGRPPFRGDTPMEIVQAVANDRPVTPRRLRPAVPRDLETVVLKALESEPAKRYPTARAMADDLRCFITSRPIQAKPPTSRDHLVKWVRRRPGLATLWGTLLAVVLGAFIAITTLWFDAVKARDQATEAGALARRESDRERRIRYVAGISAAASALELDHAVEARGLLENLPAEYRNWEWRQLAGQLDNSTIMFRPAEGPVTAFDLAPDGKSFAYAALGQTELRLRNIASSQELGRFDKLDAAITAAAFSPDGARVAAGTANGTIRVWPAAGGTAVASLAGKRAPVRSLVFDHTGSRLLSANDKLEVDLWDIALGRPIPLNREGMYLRFSPDARTVICKAPGEVKFHRAEDGQRIEICDAAEGAPQAAAFTPDGSLVATAGAFPATDVVLHPFMANGKTTQFKGHSNTVISVDFSQDGARMASGSLDQTVRLWDAKTGSSLAVLHGHRAKLLTVQFTSDSRRLLTHSEDDALRLWDTSDGASLGSLRGHATVSSIHLSRDGQLVGVLDTRGTVRIWNLDQVVRRGVLSGHESFVYDVATSARGRWIASASWDETVRFWDQSAGGRPISSKRLSGFVTSVTPAPTGDRFATVEHWGLVRMWEPPATEPLWSATFDSAHDGQSDGRPTFHPLQNVLAVAGDKNWSVRFYDATTGTPLGGLRGHELPTTDIAFSPDGQTMATADAGGELRVWDFPSRSSRLVLKAHAGPISRITFHPSGMRLASASIDGSVQIWDARTDKLVATLKHAGPVYGIAFNPDGTRLATACADNLIRLWDTTHFEQVAEIRGHNAYVHAVAWSADGTRLVSGSGDRTVRIWEAPTAPRIGATSHED
jgi:WD40 repeat protein/serine/threonine protein kinase